MENAIFASEEELNAENLKKLAEEIGVDTTDFETKLEDAKYLDLVKEDKALGDKLNVKATPTIYINGEKFQSTQIGYDPIKAEIDKHLQSE